MTPYSNYMPSRGLYDSSDPAIIAAHIDDMIYAGLDAGISSWWGQGTPTDRRVPQLLAAASGKPFSWSLYYEAEGQGDPTPGRITSDLAYIKSRYAGSSAYLKKDGKPVLFVYADAGDGCGMVDRWRQAETADFFVVLKVFSGYQSCSTQPQGWHQYAPSSSQDSQGSYSFAVSPGFWLKGGPQRLARDASRFASSVAAMVASKAAFQLVTTFNEWGEGTSVEPAREWASASGKGIYLDILHRYLVGSPTPSPSVTPSSPPPTATASPTPSSSPSPTPTASSKGGITKILTIVEENHSLSQMQAQMPYLMALSRRFAYADHFSAMRHPSLPNYLAVAGGSTFGVTDDASPSAHPIVGSSVFGQAIHAGRTAKVYAESMTSNCQENSSSDYVVRHTAWPYFTDERTVCASFQVPAGSATAGAFRTDVSAGRLPNIGWLIPNQCNNAHDCSLATADRWLATWLPAIMAGPDYQSGRLAIIVTADENDGSAGNTVLTSVLTPQLDGAGAVVRSPLSLLSLSRLHSSVVGAAPLRDAATAPDMAQAFGLRLG